MKSAAISRALVSASVRSSTKVICTPYGIRFEVNHLSPFVLSWGDDAGDEGEILPPPTELPPTGDNTPIMLYALMMAAAMVCLLTLSRRKIRG